MPDNTGYSYSSTSFRSGPSSGTNTTASGCTYFFCCFDFDRTTFEMFPDRHWANSTGYLRAMMQGFIERLYPYTGDPRTVEFLKNFVDYELENGLTPEGYAWAEVPYPSANPGAAVTPAGASTAKTSSSPTSSAKMATAISASTR